MCREPALRIMEEYCLCSCTVADWGMFCRETMLVFMACCSEKLGGPNKIVEVDESKFGRRKYHRGHTVKGQRVFGGVERESGRTFLVPVPDRNADTLVAIIRDSIEPGTTVISDCWGAYRNLNSQGFTHHTVNHSYPLRRPRHRYPHEHHRVHVARRQGLPQPIQQGGRLRVPPGTVHVHGEVQGARRFTVSAIPSPPR